VKCIDLLVNNAGINTNLGWRKCMEVNIIGVMTGTEIALERMKKQPKKGTIVNTASMAGIMAGFSEESLAYFVSKHGVVTLTRTLNASFHESGVEVKAICPAWADTEIVSGVDGAERKEAVNKLVKAHGGLMTTEYVAEAFYSLLTECPRGSCLGVMNKMPYMVIPDTSEPMVRMMVLMGLVVRKITGRQTIQVGDFKMFFAVLFLLFLLLAYIF